MQRLTILFLPLLILFFSCGDREIQDLSFEGEGFFPVEVGKYRTYEVDSIFLFNSGDHDTVRYHINELISSTFNDGEGRTSYRVERSSKFRTDSLYSPNNIWFITKTTNSVEQLEDNYRFVKMIFPVTGNRNWNGNTYIESTISSESCNGTYSDFYEEWDYVYAGINSPKSILGVDYPKTVTVNRVDAGTAIRHKYSTEAYGYEIGLIESETWDIGYAGSVIPLQIDWPERANCGYVVKTRLLEFN